MTVRRPDFLASPASSAPASEAPGFLLARFTARKMMRAAAAIGLALGVVQCGRYYLASRQYRGEATFHSELAAFYSAQERDQRHHAELIDYENDAWKRRGDPVPGQIYENPYRTQAGLSARRVEYYLRMGRKYEDAAARPWRPVEPDPLPPGFEG
ncbi:hypothetical protein OJF2_00790 [Aquisphaera giovannonii]|uniref:Transmembrane protein n=1 Tax=Aquisphaera giovannonii TaxID=406548 RepID=A0A5B9VU06_9BACT|nr:hypothetical protein [Aquisphaera giovannonii]QEH31614.1 hypothetical protein OJF2_00790 [Aquisphaera giovannonii]